MNPGFAVVTNVTICAWLFATFVGEMLPIGITVDGPVFPTVNVREKVYTYPLYVGNAMSPNSKFPT